jgi:hypothetical protein
MAMLGNSHPAASGGYWVTWEADVRTRPDAGDAVSYLRHGLKALRDHPEVASATCRYRRNEARVAFGVHIGHALTPDFAMVRAGVALRESLQRAGFGIPDPPSYAAPPMARVRLDRGPESIHRG